MGSHAVRLCTVATLLLLSAAAVGTAEAVPDPMSARVLVIHSYSEEYGWSETMNRTIKEELHGRLDGIEIHVEYLDAKRYDIARVGPPFVELLAAKYRPGEFDLVAVTDNPAFELVLEHRARLFGEVPIVFAGVNDYNPGMHRGHRDITGVAEEADIRGTLETAMMLHPDATHLVTVSDTTITGRINQAEVDRIVSDVDTGLRLVRLAGLSRGELGRRLGEIPPTSIVLNLSLFRTADGTVFSAESGGRFIVEHTDSPVYTAWDAGLGTGIVGGLLVSARGQAQEQAALIARVLEGEAANSIPVVVESPNRLTFDYRALDSHGIRMSELPPDSTILNEPETMWYRYRPYIIAVVVGFAVLSGLVTFLLTNIMRRRVAERRLKRSEQKYRSMFESLHDVYAEVRKSDGRVLTVSPSIGKFGYDPARLVGAHISTLRLSPDAQRDLVGRLDSGGSVDDYELELQTADGRPFTASISARLEGRGERDARIIGTIRDVSQRKQIEEELRRLHKAVEEAGHAVYITDAAGTIHYVNPAFEHTTGYSREEAVGRTPRILKSGAMPPGYYRRLWETINAGDTWREQITNRRRDGTLYYASQTIAPVLNAQGEIDWFVAVQTDETERVENEQQYRLLAENATDMISRHTADGTYVYVSPACRYLLGYEPEELVGVNAYELFHPEDLESIRESHRTIESGQEIAYVTYRIRRKDGRYTWFETTSKTVWDEDSQSVSEIVTVSRDVSERIRIEERLKEAKAQAESASQAKSEFLANVSHEIRTPLHAIMGFGELLKRRTDDRTAHRYVDTIEESANTLLRLISDILDLSKVEAGRLDISPEFSDPRELVASVAAMFEPEAQSRELELTRQVRDDVPAFLYVDRARVRQIVVNLVGNALKFTESGHVELALGGEQGPDGSFDLEIRVADTGIGMSAATQKHMFEAFSQGRGDTRRRHGGTGLGLAITKRLVDRMGGRIEVESREGSGSSFIVRLPGLPARDTLSAAEAAASAGPAGAEAAPGPEPGAEGPAEDRELASLAAERREALRQAIETRIRPGWRRTQQVKMVDDIVSLAEEFETLGAEFGVEAIARNGHDLADAAREFDVEAMEDGFNRFRTLARTLEVELDEDRPA
jgi:PAS domain S-box-containing protein